MRQEYQLLYLIYVVFISSALLANLLALCIGYFLKKRLSALKNKIGAQSELLLHQEKDTNDEDAE